MSARFERTFTPDEANALLDELRPLVERARQARRQLLAIDPALEPALTRAGGNGGGRVAGEAVALMETVREVVRRIQAQGVLVKDLEQGLLDFPSERQGRIVLLCWKAGEPRVAHWHDLDSGFAGRRPL